MSSTFWYILTSKQPYTPKVHYCIPRGGRPAKDSIVILGLARLGYLLIILTQ